MKTGEEAVEEAGTVLHTRGTKAISLGCLRQAAQSGPSTTWQDGLTADLCLKTRRD